MPWTRAILHVDMDAFYASVEQRDKPSLRGVPVVVGGPPEARGVVSTASYEARRFGVRSAMPMAKALRLCPHARRVSPRMDVYATESEKIHAIFARYTPTMQSVGLDEAYLDVTGSQALFGEPAAMGLAIKRAIKRETGLTASVGVAPNRFVAKIASDLEKPDGLTVIDEAHIERRLTPLPVERIWGVGPVTAAKLKKLGIDTIGQLRSWTAQALATHFGAFGRDLHDLSRGIDHGAVATDTREKSLSQEMTFPADVKDTAFLERELLRQAETVACRMRAHGLYARTVQLKLRYDDFTTVTRRVTLPPFGGLTDIVHQAAVGLLRTRTDAGSRPVRLIGVGVSNLDAAGTVQGSLFAGPDDNSACVDGRRGRMEDAIDRIRSKLGQTSIMRASLLEDDEDAEQQGSPERP